MKPDASSLQETPFLKKTKDLVENLKNGIQSADADLVIEANDENRINKCPITAKEIVEEFKNSKCGHLYEKSAITQYCKGKSKK